MQSTAAPSPGANISVNSRMLLILILSGVSRTHISNVHAFYLCHVVRAPNNKLLALPSSLVAYHL